ncbi:MAG: cytochrome c biogenesis protein CcsA [Bacteroidetes bacterium]|nr:cytochrome c biogenesis protein CcsA [Bacteroidota bacterium]
MEIKMTTMGLLIYITMFLYLLAMTFTIRKKSELGKKVFLLGFTVAVVSFVYRYIDVAHWPMQNLFEVFMSLGLFIYPISILSEKYLNVRGGASDMLLGVVILFPAGFVFTAEPQQLPPALQSWLFAPHVAVYMISYVLMAKAAIQAGFQLKETNNKLSGEYEQATYNMVRVGFPFLTLGLILGSWWGKLAWGDFWAWDPKELWSLISWLIFVGYLHVRYMFGRKYSRYNSYLAILGMVAIILTLLWVNLSKLFPGLHNYAS